jgi:putative membrane protein
MQEKRRILPLVLLLTGLGALAWSGIVTSDRANWVAETLPAMIGTAVMVGTYRKFALTNVSYVLVWFFCLILVLGGCYTYAEVPVGNWAKEAFGLSRNHFDRVGHFFQGVIPAMLARELLIRMSPLKPGKWLFFICMCVAMFVSAMYELIEWRYAVLFGGEQAETFLGSQGDVWDAQQDMFMALCGGVLSQLALGWVQDGELKQGLGSGV